MGTSAFERVQGGLRRLTIEQLQHVAEEADALLKQRQADAIIAARRRALMTEVRQPGRERNAVGADKAP